METCLVCNTDWDTWECNVFGYCHTFLFGHIAYVYLEVSSNGTLRLDVSYPICVLRYYCVSLQDVSFEATQSMRSSCHWVCMVECVDVTQWGNCVCARQVVPSKYCDDLRTMTTLLQFFCKGKVKKLRHLVAVWFVTVCFLIVENSPA